MSEFEEISRDRHYSTIAKLLHWGFVILFFYGIIKQVDNINQLEDISVLRLEILFATIFVLLLAIRFTYMKKTKKSSLPNETPKSQKLAAKIMNYGMYISLAAITCSG